MIRTISAVIFASLILTGARADQITTTFDLGPNNVIINGVDIPLSSFLAGTPLDGRSVSVDINFANGEYLSPDVIGKFFGALTVFTTLTTGTMPASGYMVDPLGQPMPTTFSMASAFTSGLGFVLVFAQNPQDVYGMHLDFTLPNDPGATITGSAADIIVDSGSATDRFFVSPWTVVPDGGATAGLLTASLAVLAFVKRRV